MNQQKLHISILLKNLLIGGQLAFTLGLTTSVSAQSFTEQTSFANPLYGVYMEKYAAPAFVDIDADGDFDVFIGNGVGTILYFENTGTNSDPSFIPQTDATNPFDGVDIGSESKPVFRDLDNDGDSDAFIGGDTGRIYYFENTGTSNSPIFIEQMGNANPFNGVDLGYDTAPAFSDLDNDGDDDAFIGESQGVIHYFKNTGTIGNPVFIAQEGSANPFHEVDGMIPYSSVPAFVDVDHDEDMDVFVGEILGRIDYFQNIGTNSDPAFSQQTGADNDPLWIDIGNNAAPTFVDIDNDGDMDAFIGTYLGTILYYENTTPPVSGELLVQKENNQVGFIYPNPSNAGAVQLDYLAVQSEPIALSVLDITGKRITLQEQLVYEGNNTLHLDTSGLNRGIYLVQVEAKAGVVLRKLVIE